MATSIIDIELSRLVDEVLRILNAMLIFGFYTDSDSLSTLFNILIGLLENLNRKGKSSQT